MDLGLFARVLWRFKVVTAIGLVLAVALTALTFSTTGKRSEWVSYETVLITQRGFTEGRTDEIGAAPSRLTLLGLLYSQFTTDDTVTHQLWPHGRDGESVEAAPVLQIAGNAASGVLPIVSIAAFSSTGPRSQRLATRATAALIAYVERRQQENHIPVGKRVVMAPVATAAQNPPKLWKGPSKAVPIVVFLTVLIATIGLAFVLENLRPRIRPLQGEEPRLAGTAS